MGRIFQRQAAVTFTSASATTASFTLASSPLQGSLLVAYLVNRVAPWDVASGFSRPITDDIFPDTCIEFQVAPAGAGTSYSFTYTGAAGVVLGRLEEWTGALSWRLGLTGNGSAATATSATLGTGTGATQPGSTSSSQELVIAVAGLAAVVSAPTFTNSISANGILTAATGSLSSGNRVTAAPGVNLNSTVAGWTTAANGGFVLATFIPDDGPIPTMGTRAWSRSSRGLWVPYQRPVRERIRVNTQPPPDAQPASSPIQRFYPAAKGPVPVPTTPATTVTSQPIDIPQGALVQIVLLSTGNGAAFSATGVTDTSGTGAVWALVVRSNVFSAAALSGTAEVWEAYFPRGASQVTITATWASAPTDPTPAGMAQPIVLLGAAAKQTGRATQTQSSTTGATPSMTLTTTRPGSLVLAAVENWSNPASPIASTTEFILSWLRNSAVNAGYWVQAKSACTPASGTSVTSSATSPTGIHLNAVQWEVQADPSLAGIQWINQARDGSRRPGPPYRRPRAPTVMPYWQPQGRDAGYTDSPTQRRPPRALRRARGHQFEPPWTTAAIAAPTWPPALIVQPRRARGWRLWRGRRFDVTPPQVPVPPYIPALIVQPRRARGWRLWRGRRFDVTPPQVPVPPFIPPNVVQPRRARGWRLWRGRRADVITVESVEADYIDNPNQPRRARGWRLWRGRRFDVTPPQVPVPPFIPPNVVQPRRARGWRLVRGRQVQPVQPQAAIPPPYPVPNVVQPRRARGWRLWRGRRFDVTPPQVIVALLYPPANVAQPRRARGLRLARGRRLEHVQPHQHAAPPPARRRPGRPVPVRRPIRSRPSPAPFDQGPAQRRARRPVRPVRRLVRRLLGPFAPPAPIVGSFPGSVELVGQVLEPVELVGQVIGEVTAGGQVLEPVALDGQTVGRVELVGQVIDPTALG